ncbi:MAG: FdhF/YdeP family oxidoreductase [Saprospiraceae bacterium]
MKKNKGQHDSELTPEGFTGLKLTKPKTTAAGMPAVTSTVRHIFNEMDPARAAKVLFRLNQACGVDCPGCAWPDPEGERSKLGEYCENGAKAIAEEATTKEVMPDFFAKNSIQFIGEQSDFWIGKRGRLTHPMILEEGATHYTPISWDDAFKEIGKELNALETPDDAVFYTSGRTANETAFMYQLFVRMYGTNNMPDCSNMCHESSGVALGETLGIGKGSVTLEDFNHADVIMVIGQNPGTNHPRMLSALKKAKNKGAKIITINPLPETGLIRFKDPQSVGDMLGRGTQLTDLFLQVKINGDVPLFKAMLHLLWQREQAERGSEFDWGFIENRTVGFEAMEADMAAQDPKFLAEQCGISMAQITEAVDMLKGKKKIIACWAMGITQHKNGVANIQEIVNLLLLKGSIAKTGAGTCPVRGHSNVQGDRTMGIYEKPPAKFLAALDAEFGIDTPKEHGLDVVDSIKRMHEHKDMVFVAMGGNFLSATPDTSYTAVALRNCSLTVQISTKLNRSHLVTGRRALILPSLGRTDEDVKNGIRQFVSVENSMGVVHSSTGKLKPLAKTMMSEPSIVAGIAKATLQSSPKVDWEGMSTDYDSVRDKIEAVIPGFEKYNERVREPNGFHLPNGARSGMFNLPNQRARFTVNAIPDNQLVEGELMMTTVRSHDQFNTTIYGLDDRYRGILNERRVILMNEKDIARRGLTKGDVVDIWGEFKGVKRHAPRFLVVPFDVPESCCVTYFPETNVLVPIDSVAARSNTPTSKLVRITLEKVEV